VHFVPRQQKLSVDRQQLLDLFDQLDSQQRRTLLSFAAFLKQHECLQDEAEEDVTHQPKAIQRPDSETVVKAIRRLSESYFMLESERLLDETSSLMMAHTLQGRDAKLVIDELEALFARHYQSYLDERE
jgi:hypothetical protein